MHHSDCQFSPGACALDCDCPYYLQWAFTMVTKDPDKLFIANIAATTIERVKNPQNDDVPDVEDFDDDASAFTTQTVDSLLVGGIFSNPTV